MFLVGGNLQRLHLILFDNATYMVYTVFVSCFCVLHISLRKLTRNLRINPLEDISSTVFRVHVINLLKVYMFGISLCDASSAY